MNKKLLIIVIFLIVFLGMFFTHPYVIYLAEGWGAEILEIFDSKDECVKATNNDPARDRIRLLTCDKTNGVALLSALIDVRSESVVRALDGLRGCEVQNRATDPLSYNALKNGLSVQRLDPEVIRYRVAELLSPSRDVRDRAIEVILKDIESTFDPSYGTGLRSFTHWGVTIERMYPIYANPLVDGPPLSSDQQVFWTIVSSHYKAILFEEVEKHLKQQAMSSDNQYIKEIEAMEKMWGQKSAGNEQVCGDE